MDCIGGPPVSGIRDLAATLAAIGLSCVAAASVNAQSAAQLRQWQDWCDGRNGATAEQTAEGCVNLMQSKRASSPESPPPQAPPHKAIAHTSPRQFSTQQTMVLAPSLDDNASLTDFLQAARGAVAAGRIAEANDALERAESRVLTRSETVSAALEPSKQQLVLQIADARAALLSGDRMKTLDLIDLAMRNPEATEPSQ